MNPNKYQDKIYETLGMRDCNLQIEAVAGSGKTTTLVEIAKRLPSDKKVAVICFNKETANQFEGRFPTNCHCITLHAMGCMILRENGMWFKINSRKVDNLLKYDILGYGKDQWKSVDKVDVDFYYEHRKNILKLVSIFKGMGISSLDYIGDQFQTVCERFGIDLGDEALSIKGIVCQLYELSIHKEKTIDFDDMILFPVFMGLKFPHYDYVLIDEVQDLNICQRMFVEKWKGTARIIAVGDRHQSIYGFRGADANSMDEFSKAFNPKHLDLSICYRCSKAVVEEANKIVPYIEAAEDALPGIVKEIHEETMEDII